MTQPPTPVAGQNDAFRLDRCQQRIGYRFQDPQLLDAALTHASGADHRLSSNERLEFLGDAILGLVVCEQLFQQFPEQLEGDLTKLKSIVVSRQTCAKISQALGLREFLVLGKGMTTHPAVPPSVLSDVLESLIAAIYLDGGIEPARAFIERQFRDLIAEARRSGAEAAFTEDYKSALQEWLQSNDRGLPVYRLIAEIGPAHHRRFEVEVIVGGVPVSRAEGKSKKAAAQSAAKLALATMKQER
jgi:ribonuclease-3